MRVFAAVILMALLGGPAPNAQAQLPQTDNGPFYRYIILVDGSSAMGRRKNAVAQTIGELIYNGFDGQAQSGDIFGIWTFQDTVDAVSVPAQRWTLNNRNIMAANAVKHITSFKYRKRSNLDAAVSEMIRATKISKEVTIFLVSDGNEVIYGTPYDLDISTTFVLHRQELSSAKQPFVTSIAARDGRMQAWSVEAGDGKVSVPSIPDKDPPAPLTKTNPVSPQSPPTQPKTTPQPPKPGTQPEAEPSVATAKTTSKPPAAAPRKPVSPPIVKKAETTEPPTSPPQAIVPPPSKPEPVVVQTITPPTRPVIETPRTSAPNPSVESQPQAREPVKITSPRSNINTATAQPRSAQLTRSQSASRQFPGTERSLPDSAATTTSAPKGNPTPLPSPTPSTTSKPAVAPTPATNAPAPSPPIIATKTSPTPAKEVSSATVKSPAKSLNETPSAPPAPTAAQTGMILPAEEPGSPTRMLFFVLTLLLITGIMVSLALRRSRAPSQASLISQSLDRERR